MVPTVRLTFLMGSRMSTGSFFSRAVWHMRQERGHVERQVEAVVLLDHPAHRDVGAHLRPVENAREVEAARLPVIHRGLDLQEIHPPDHLVHGPEAEPAP